MAAPYVSPIAELGFDPEKYVFSPSGRIILRNGKAHRRIVRERQRKRELEEHLDRVEQQHTADPAPKKRIGQKRKTPGSTAPPTATPKPGGPSKPSRSKKTATKAKKPPTAWRTPLQRVQEQFFKEHEQDLVQAHQKLGDDHAFLDYATRAFQTYMKSCGPTGDEENHDDDKDDKDKDPVMQPDDPPPAIEDDDNDDDVDREGDES